MVADCVLKKKHLYIHTPIENPCARIHPPPPSPSCYIALMAEEPCYFPASRKALMASAQPKASPASPYPEGRSKVQVTQTSSHKLFHRTCASRYCIGNNTRVHYRPRIFFLFHIIVWKTLLNLCYLKEMSIPSYLLPSFNLLDIFLKLDYFLLFVSLA